MSEVEIGGLAVSKEQARKWLSEINRLEKKYGRIPTDEEILEAASNPKSAFHAFVFDKTQEEAARAYYIARVQYIMRHLAAITTTVNGGKASFRLFVRTPDGYERTTDVAPESITAAAISRKLALEIASAQRRAEAWRMLLGTSKRDQADKVIKHLEIAASLVGTPSREKRGRIMQKGWDEILAEVSQYRLADRAPFTDTLEAAAESIEALFADSDKIA